MQLNFTWRGLAFLATVSVGMVACSDNDAGMTPTAPTAAAPAAVSASTAAAPAASNPDGSNLKVTTPANLSPANRVRTDTRTPTLQWNNSVGRFQAAPSFSYEVEIYKVNDLVTRVDVASGAGTSTAYAVPSDLDYDTLYRWRVRAKMGSFFGPWAGTVDFETPLPPAPPPPSANVGSGGGGGQPLSGQRNISFNEAFSFLVSYHDITRANLGSSSTRESRVAWLWEAVAVLHYGHAVYNPQGGDRNWCVKDAGGGRPPSDDVIVRCDSRDAWDLISGAGANGYSWDWHSVGVLGREQNVYPPPLGSLPR